MNLFCRINLDQSFPQFYCVNYLLQESVGISPREPSDIESGSVSREDRQTVGADHDDLFIASLYAGAGGFPEIDFSAGECTFCGACVDACVTGALGPVVNDDDSPQQPWKFEIDVSEACMSVQGVICRVCPEHCDVGAIRFATPAAIGCPEIDNQKCTGCGACVAPCPTGAISIQPAG